MILFVLGFLWIPSVIGGCTKEEGDCKDGSCSDSCYIWRGPNEVDSSLHFCTGDDVVDFITDSSESCKKVLGLPEYAQEDWSPISYWSATKTCIIMSQESKRMGTICECKRCLEPTPPPTPPTPKSKLSTEAIIGITLEALFIISITAYIFRNQLPCRFAKQTGEQLIQ